jgi:hypothetical protein
MMRAAADRGSVVARTEVFVHELGTERRCASLRWVEGVMERGNYQELDVLVMLLLQAGEHDMAERCRERCLQCMREQVSSNDAWAAWSMVVLLDTTGCRVQERGDLVSALHVLAGLGDQQAVRRLTETLDW